MAELTPDRRTPLGNRDAPLPPFIYRNRKFYALAAFSGVILGGLALIYTLAGAAPLLTASLWAITFGSVAICLQLARSTLTITQQSLTVKGGRPRRVLLRSEVDGLTHSTWPYRMLYYVPRSGKPVILPTPQYRNTTPVIDALRARGWPVVFDQAPVDEIRRGDDPRLPVTYRQSARGFTIVSLTALFTGAAIFFAVIGTLLMTVLSALLAALFGYFVWTGGTYEYLIDATGLMVSPRRPPDRFVPASEILRVQPHALRVGGSRVWLYRVHIADSTAIDLHVGFGRRRRRTAAAFRAIGVEVEAE